MTKWCLQGQTFPIALVSPSAFTFTRARIPNTSGERHRIELSAITSVGQRISAAVQQYPGRALQRSIQQTPLWMHGEQHGTKRRLLALSASKRHFQLF